MNFRRFINLILCLVWVFCAVNASVSAGHHAKFEKIMVTNAMGNSVLVEVQDGMFQGRIFHVGGVSYREREWVEFFVRKLLVGSCGDTVTKVVLRKPRRRDSHFKWLLCPPIFAEADKDFGVSKSGSDLTVLCADLDRTLYGDWYLNESGLAVSRQYS